MTAERQAMEKAMEGSAEAMKTKAVLEEYKVSVRVGAPYVYIDVAVLIWSTTVYIYMHLTDAILLYYRNLCWHPPLCIDDFTLPLTLSYVGIPGTSWCFTDGTACSRSSRSCGHQGG